MNASPEENRNLQRLNSPTHFAHLVQFQELFLPHMLPSVHLKEVHLIKYSCHRVHYSNKKLLLSHILLLTLLSSVCTSLGYCGYCSMYQFLCVCLLLMIVEDKCAIISCLCLYPSTYSIAPCWYL